MNGLLIPGRFSITHLARSPRFALQGELLQQAGARTPDFGEQVNDILAFLGGTYVSTSGLSVEAVPGTGADAQVWILGSSAGQSAQVAGALGLPFAANYHVSPATVLEAVEAYRAAFRPSAVLATPHVQVSADVVVAPTDAEARELASGYGLWVRSIRTGDGAMRFPSPSRGGLPVDGRGPDTGLGPGHTQLAGVPAIVAEHLRVLQDATDADELLVTTITHSHSEPGPLLRTAGPRMGPGLTRCGRTPAPRALSSAAWPSQLLAVIRALVASPERVDCATDLLYRCAPMARARRRLTIEATYELQGEQTSPRKRQTFTASPSPVHCWGCDPPAGAKSPALNPNSPWPGSVCPA